MSPSNWMWNRLTVLIESVVKWISAMAKKDILWDDGGSDMMFEKGGVDDDNSRTKR